MEDSISFASNHAKASRYRKLETRVQVQQVKPAYTVHPIGTVVA